MRNNLPKVLQFTFSFKKVDCPNFILSFNFPVCKCQKLGDENHTQSKLSKLTSYKILIIQKADKGPFIQSVCKIFRKTNISNPLIHTRRCAYQEVRIFSFSESFTNVLNKWSLMVTLKRFWISILILKRRNNYTRHLTYLRKYHLISKLVINNKRISPSFSYKYCSLRGKIWLVIVQSIPELNFEQRFLRLNLIQVRTKICILIDISYRQYYLQN